MLEAPQDPKMSGIQAVTSWISPCRSLTTCDHVRSELLGMERKNPITHGHSKGQDIQDTTYITDQPWQGLPTSTNHTPHQSIIIHIYIYIHICIYVIWIISTRWPSIVPRVSADAVDEGPRSLGYWLKGHITRIGRGKERCAPLVWGSLLVVPTWNIWLPFTSNYHLSEDRLSGLVDKPWGQGLDIWLRATSVEGSPRPLTLVAEPKCSCYQA